MSLWLENNIKCTVLSLYNRIIKFFDVLSDMTVRQHQYMGIEQINEIQLELTN